MKWRKMRIEKVSYQVQISLLHQQLDTNKKKKKKEKNKKADQWI